MTLVCRPKGRGNWHVLTLKLDGPLISAIVIAPGEVFTLGGIVYRIVEVKTS